MRESRSSHLLRSFSQPTGMRNNNSNINNINSSSVNTESALRISTTAAKITHKARGAQDLFSRVLQRSLSQPASFKPQLQQQQQQQHHQLSDQQTTSRDNNGETATTAPTVERTGKCSDSNSSSSFSDISNAFSNNSSRGEWSSSSARKESQADWTHGKSAKGPKQLLRRYSKGPKQLLRSNTAENPLESKHKRFNSIKICFRESQL